MKSRCDFGAYGEISATGENGFENLKICIFLHVERQKNSKNQEKNALFFALFSRNIFAGIEKAITLHSLFQG
ncbi:MAG: hypothetical protein L6U16_14165 [Porphyromonadaceae bacterium]|nr:MAG: hypothetical protein L6U16_14165 [Porphyromonadaceae bacterium]